MKIMLISDSGEVIASTDVTAAELAQAVEQPVGAQALLREIA